MMTQVSEVGFKTTKELKPSFEKLLADIVSVWGTEWSTPDVVYMPVWENIVERTARFTGTYFANCLAAWYSHDAQSQKLWSTLLGKRQTMQVATADEIIDIEYANRLSSYVIERAIVGWRGAEFEPEIALELDVVKLFKKIPDVQSIYTDEYVNRKRFLILTSNEKYDDPLMDQLLSLERELRLSHDEIAISFVYIPKLLDSGDEIIPRDSKLIYERGYDVKSAGPLVASGTERETSQATA
jgi:hypothetical protein